MKKNVDKGRRRRRRWDGGKGKERGRREHYERISKERINERER